MTDIANRIRAQQVQKRNAEDDRDGGDGWVWGCA